MNTTRAEGRETQTEKRHTHRETTEREERGEECARTNKRPERTEGENNFTHLS